MSDVEAYVYHLIDKVYILVFSFHLALTPSQGLIPDFVLRPVIRALCYARLRQLDLGSFEANHAAKMSWIQAIRDRDTIADTTHKPNQQHYEVRVCISST